MSHSQSAVWAWVYMWSHKDVVEFPVRHGLTCLLLKTLLEIEVFEAGDGGIRMSKSDRSVQSQQTLSSWFRGVDYALLLCLASLVACVCFATIAASSWPLVGDEGLMHYVVFLLGRGLRPYAQVVDINQPGAYALDWVTIHGFGSGAIGLRVYDGSLCLCACACSAALGGRDRWGRLLGAMAGLLFVLLHLRDGAGQAGQRDLALAVIGSFGMGILLWKPLRDKLAGGVLAGLLFGATLTVKPTLVLLILTPVVACNRPRSGSRQWILYACSLLVGPGIMLLWLWQHGATSSFVHTMNTVGAAHAELARRSFSNLLLHAADPLNWLFVGTAVLALRFRRLLRREDLVLAYGALAGLGSLVVQGKGFPYQRYPFLLFGLMLAFRMLGYALAAGGFDRAAAGIVLGCISLIVAPIYAVRVSQYPTASPFVSTLRAALEDVKPGEQVQCLDTVGGCLTSLYDAGTVQATGYLYDCYAYAGNAEQQSAYRTGFMRALAAAKPQYLVLTNNDCLQATGSFLRVKRWPELQYLLDSDYQLKREWTGTEAVRGSHLETGFSWHLLKRKE